MKGIFDLFLDDELRRPGDVSELAADVTSLLKVARKQAEQLKVLYATIDVLTDVLEERGLIDEATLFARAADRLRLQEAAPPPPREMLSCGRCGANLPKSMTTTTPDGVLCDACFETGAG